MSRNPKKGEVFLPVGAYKINNKGEAVAVNSIIAQEPNDCCGIDCCYGFLVLPNYSSISGDAEVSALYLVDGVPVVSNIQDAKDAITAFKNNTSVAATGVTISGCLVTALPSGQTRQLTASVQPVGAIQTGTWTSNNTEVLAVSSTGLVTSGDPGTATITFTSTDGSFTAQCTITVTD